MRRTSAWKGRGESSGKRKIGLAIILGLLVASTVLLLAQYGNPRVDNFLNSLSTLASADAGRAAFNAAKFSEAERRLLENGLRDPKYAIHIERLVKTIKGRPPQLQLPVKAVAVLNEEQGQRIAGINLRLRTETQTLMAASAKVLSSAALQAVVGTLPKITSLSQQTIEPGQSLIISGTDFLPRGSVTFTFASSSFDAQVSEWTNDLIFAQLPAGIRGVMEMDGNVTVRKQGRMLRADAAIHFVPTWDHQVISSTLLTYASQPYDLATALALFFFTGATQWCAQFNIYFPDVPSYKLINAWSIHSLYYKSDFRAIELQNENTLSYIGSTTLPNRTSGQICHSISGPAMIYCLVTIKGPLGVPYK